MDQRPGYPPVVATGYPQKYYYSSHQQQAQQQQTSVPPEYPPKAAGYPNNPYIFTTPESTSKRGCHSPDCERKRKTGIANALAALFIVCWCCTWPCHGPCCCGF